MSRLEAIRIGGQCKAGANLWCRRTVSLYKPDHSLPPLSCDGRRPLSEIKTVMATSKTKPTAKAVKAKAQKSPAPLKNSGKSGSGSELMRSVKSAVSKAAVVIKSAVTKPAAKKPGVPATQPTVPAKKTVLKKKEVKSVTVVVKNSKPVRASSVRAASKTGAPTAVPTKKLKSVADSAAALVSTSTKKSSSPPMPVTKNSSTDRVAVVSPAPSSSKVPQSGRSMPEPNKPRVTRGKHQESSPAPVVLASNAAKATYGQFVAPAQPTHPVPAATKKDPKLANNWKTKTAEQMTDAEIMAMPESEYMSSLQLQYFRAKLIQLKREILDSASETTEHLRDDSSVVPDPTDRATIEEEHALELRTRDRERKLLKKIEQSIARIDAGDYGYCDETGEPIGAGRLLARPTATLSLEAQQRRELKQKLFGD